MEQRRKIKTWNAVALQTSRGIREWLTQEREGSLIGKVTDNRETGPAYTILL